MSQEFSQLKVELEQIKKLFILVLLKSGMSQSEIGNALGVNQSTISRMMPKAKKNEKRGAEAAEAMEKEPEHE